MANYREPPVLNCLFQLEDGRLLKGKTTKPDPEGYFVVKADWNYLPADLRERWLTGMGGYGSGTPEYIVARVPGEKVTIMPDELFVALPREIKVIPCIWRWKDARWLHGVTPDRYNPEIFWGERTRVVRVEYADMPADVRRWLNRTLYGVWLAPPYVFLMKPEEQVVVIEPGLGTV